jgi:hypothetical protein
LAGWLHPYAGIQKLAFWRQAMNYFTLRGGFRNWLARLLVDTANKLATHQTMCCTRGKWKFQREWEAVPLRPQPHPHARQDSEAVS